MISTPNYIVTDPIVEGSRSLIYHGYRKSDKKKVIVKLLGKDHPSIDEINRFNHEYEILKNLHGDGTIQVCDFEKFQNKLAIILEEFGTISLQQLLSQKKLSLIEFLTLALHITEALEKIHQHNVIHKDINPSNILIDMPSLQAKIIDFDIATTLPREIAEIRDPKILQEGTLIYISPEQTGRMNRGIDYRTDYYSLGITFYQMATGIIPFQTEDPAELVHCHIAKLPKPPHEVDPSIPPVVSNIIMKLLAKIPEERYQSTFGLKADIKNCIEQLNVLNKINDFPIATKDISARFQLSEKLYGREAELNYLLQTFERINKGHAELVLVNGYSGVGKTTLVHELYKPLLTKRGYFISGKFDQFKRNVPYASFIQAFQELIQKILIEGEDEIAIWRQRIQQAVGKNGRLMTDIIPLLSSIIGEQTPLPALEPLESEKRFHQVFQNLIQSFSSMGHPLIIFLDDCQWADISSLNLLETLLANPLSQYFLVICAYRSNEIGSGHLLKLSLDNFQKKGIQINTLTILPLKLKDIIQMLADSLHLSPDDVQTLAEICFSKTEGNPFFLNQFLQSLYQEELITFDSRNGIWQWDTKQIEQKEITNNVVEFMAEKIKRLSPIAQRALQLASCVGSHFDLNFLSMIAEKSRKQVTKELWEAQEKGLIIAKGQSYQIVFDSQISNVKYQFAHDRVQQAAYSLINEEERNPIHLKIGRLLIKNTKKEKIHDAIFDIVDQINFGINLITDPDEKHCAIELNLMAAEKAKKSIAYKSTLVYLKMAMALLNKDSWKKDYPLTLSIYTQAAEAAFLALEFKEMEKYSEIVIQHAKNILDKIPIYGNLIYHLVHQKKSLEALKMGFQVLSSLGIKMPRKASTYQVILSLIKTKWALLGKTTDDLYHLPEMTDPYYRAAMQILIDLLRAGNVVDPKFWLIINLQALRLTVRYGNNEYCPTCYAAYAFTLCAIFNQIELGHQFIQMALKLADRYKLDNYLKGSVVGVQGIIMPWYDHLDESLRTLHNAFQMALESGNSEVLIVTIGVYIPILFQSGKPLNTSSKEMKHYIDILTNHGEVDFYHHMTIYLQGVLNLLDFAKNPALLIGAECNEEKLISLFKEKKDHIGFLYLYSMKLQLAYLFHDYQAACEYGEKALHYKSVEGPAAPDLYFYYSLACLARYPKASKNEQSKLLKVVKKNQKRLDTWAKHAPMNFLHKYLLVEAEKENRLGHLNQAESLFDKSISLASENHFINDEALANERAALFYLNQNKEKIAKLYMTEAHYSYTQWGATAKVQHLEKSFSNLLTSTTRKESHLTVYDSTTHSSTTHSIADILDLNAVLKISQSISREIELPDLLKKTMRIVIENAGAQKGYLLLEKDNRWVIEAEATIDSEQTQIMQSISMDEVLPSSLIHYVIRTKTSLALADAIKAEQFAMDPYIQKNKPKSILCMPLVNQGIVTSVLYLENNLANDVFTEERLSLLSLLSGQIVTAIDNAKLYSDLKELNQANESFVPKEFLRLLEKKSVIDLRLGDQVQKEMTVMFTDIRGFTALSEKMTPQESITFVNGFFSKMEPVITQHLGVIDKYIGDAIMVLFPKNPDDALQCAIAMLKELERYNKERFETSTNQLPIAIGIGLNTGLLVLGTVGDSHRMEGTVISDAVNIASRIESLTKHYHVNIMITENTYDKLKNPQSYAIRKLDTVIVKGKSMPIIIYEVFDNNSEQTISLKKKSQKEFEHAIELFHQKKYSKALMLFKRILQDNPDDLPASYYIKRCQHKLSKIKHADKEF